MNTNCRKLLDCGAQVKKLKGEMERGRRRRRRGMEEALWQGGREERGGRGKTQVCSRCLSPVDWFYQGVVD